MKTEYRKPFWLIAHRVNDVRDINYCLDNGANACEIDVNFDTSEKKWYVQHQSVESKLNISFDQKVTVSQWFTDAKLFTNRLILVIVDVKEPCPESQIKLLHSQIRKTKFKATIIFSVSTQVDCLLSLENSLSANEGLTTDFLSLDRELIAKLPNDSNIWYGNGAASFLPKPELYSSIQDAVFLRDNGKKIKKVYCWTLASPYSVSIYLDADVDGMIVEQDFIATARRIINDHAFVRMATVDDEPFEKSEYTCEILNKLGVN